MHDPRFRFDDDIEKFIEDELKDANEEPPERKHPDLLDEDMVLYFKTQMKRLYTIICKKHIFDKVNPTITLKTITDKLNQIRERHARGVLSDNLASSYVCILETYETSLIKLQAHEKAKKKAKTINAVIKKFAELVDDPTEQEPTVEEVNAVHHPLGLGVVVKKRAVEKNKLVSCASCCMRRYRG